MASYKRVLGCHALVAEVWNLDFDMQLPADSTTHKVLLDRFRGPATCGFSPSHYDARYEVVEQYIAAAKSFAYELGQSRAAERSIGSQESSLGRDIDPGRGLGDIGF